MAMNTDKRYDRKLWIGDFLRNVVYLAFELSNGKADVGGVGGKDTPMDRIHQDEHTGEQFLLDLDEIARTDRGTARAPRG
jgi:hypothetical protein